MPAAARKYDVCDSRIRRDAESMLGKRVMFQVLEKPDSRCWIDWYEWTRLSQDNVTVSIAQYRLGGFYDMRFVTL